MRVLLDLDKITLGIVLLKANNNRYETLASLMKKVNETLGKIQDGEVILING
jgi:hypothetical protein